MKNTIIVLSVVVMTTVTGLIVLSMRATQQPSNASTGSNVTDDQGTQIITLTAKGGYKPGVTVAKASMPTKLRINTNGTFDCSSALRIPSLNITQALPPSGATDIDLGVNKAGTLRGTCGMGMYHFQIQFND